MKIIEIIETIPIVADRIGCSRFTKGKLKIAANIAIHPKTKVVSIEKLVSLKEFFALLKRCFGSVIIIKPIPIVNNHKKEEYSVIEKFKKLFNKISMKPIIEMIAKTLVNFVETLFLLRVLLFF